MAAPNDYRGAYARLYGEVKANLDRWLKEFKVSAKDADRIIDAVRRLPHPLVAIEADILDACDVCISGPLEWFFRYLGEPAQAIKAAILSRFPRLASANRAGPIPPPPPLDRARYTPEAAVDHLNYLVSSAYETLRLSHQIAATVLDYDLKGQCPHCGGDLVERIVGNELRLFCRTSGTTSCPRDGWLIGHAVP